MNYAQRKIAYACSLWLILMTAIVGQEVHIYNEDPLHFAAFCHDLAPDNGADSQVVEQCKVCDFCFYPCVGAETLLFATYFELVGRQADAPICAKQQSASRLASLRAPPSVA